MRRSTFMRALTLCAGLFTSAAFASIITYYGNDNGVIAGGAHPNATAALNSFSSAAGATTLINFEGVANSVNPSNVTVASGVTLSVSGNATGGGIRNTADSAGPLGFNTSAVGSNWLQMRPPANSSGGASAVFSFANAIDSFGLFFTDTEVNFPGNITISVNDGAAQQFGLTKGADGGGILFFGLTDFGNSFDTVTISTGSTSSLHDIFGIDDVLFGLAPTSSVPEPDSLALFGLALAGVAALRRSRVTPN